MLYELLFAGLCLATVGGLVVALVQLLRGARSQAGRMLLALCGIWAGYLAVVAVVAALTPQRVVPFGQDLCFDEVCFAVVRTETVAEIGQGAHAVHAQGLFRIVMVKVSNHARGRTQREGGLHALLRDAGMEYAVSPAGQSAWNAGHGAGVPLDAQLAPGESVQSVQVFDLPAAAGDPELMLSHGSTPGYFVIGQSPMLHKPTVMRLQP